MRASQTVLPFKLTASDELLTAHAGLVLFDEYLRAMGIAGLINHELPGAGSAAGYNPSAHVAPLVLMLAGGGRTLEDLRILRRDDGLRCVVGLDDMPSSDARGDWMRRMGQTRAEGRRAVGRISGEWRVHVHIVRWSSANLTCARSHQSPPCASVRTDSRSIGA